MARCYNRACDVALTLLWVEFIEEFAEAASQPQRTCKSRRLSLVERPQLLEPWVATPVLEGASRVQKH